MPSTTGSKVLGRGDVVRARSQLDATLAISRPSGEIDLVLPALWGLAETALVAADPVDDAKDPPGAAVRSPTGLLAEEVELLKRLLQE